MSFALRREKIIFQYSYGSKAIGDGIFFPEVPEVGWVFLPCCIGDRL